MKNLSNIIPLFAILLITLFLSSCSSVKEITSSPAPGKIIIDGNPLEWENQLKYIEDQKCAVGFMNDNEYVYLCLETSDRSKIMKILSFGLTSWVEPNDGKILGIKYPMQVSVDRIKMRPPEKGQFQNMEDPEGMNKRVEELLLNQRELQIVNEDDFPLYAYPVNDPLGFQVALGLSMGKLVYELRIPYGANAAAPIIINAYGGENLIIKFETGKFSMPETGTRGGMGGGMRPGGRPSGDMTSPFELKLNIKLAK